MQNHSIRFVLPAYQKYFSLWVLLLPIFFLLQEPTGFPYPTGDARFSDVSISHYPNLVYLKRTLFDDGVIPLWSPAIYSGVSLVGNPLAGLWYPPGWLALLFPLPFGINLVAALHLLWGGIGLYLFLTGSGLSQRGSVFGALAFISAPKIFAHYGAGHLTLLYAVMWTPWLILAAYKSQTIGGKWHIYPSLVLGMIFLADPRWSIYAGILWVAYVVAHSFITKNLDLDNDDSRNSWGGRPVGLQLVKVVVRICLQTVAAVLIACPLLIPLREAVSLSTRANLKPGELTVFSLPPARLLGLLFPDYGGNHEFTVYTGAVVLLLVVISILRKGKKPVEKFWLAVAGVAILAGLGAYLPGYGEIVQFPVLRYLRVPSRALFLSVMACAIVAGMTLDAFLKDGGVEPRQRVSLSLTAVTGLAVALAGGVWALSREYPKNFVIGALLILVTSVLLGSRLQKGIIKNGWYPVLLGLALLDWGFFNLSVLDFQAREVVLSEKQEVATYLDGQPGIFRVYSPSYSVPQQVACEFGLELADGVDPLVLGTYAAYMTAASGVPIQGYSVTIPPFATGDLNRDNAGYLPDVTMLGLLNVGYVVSAFDLAVDGLELQEKFGETRVYSNRAFLPRAWVQPVESEIGSKIIPVDNIDRHPNQIDLVVSGPGLFVLSEVAYPGWRVWVDEEETQILVVNEILRGTLVGPGDHTVTFKYRPNSVVLGLSGFFVGVLVAVGYAMKSERRRNSR